MEKKEWKTAYTRRRRLIPEDDDFLIAEAKKQEPEMTPVTFLHYIIQRIDRDHLQ